MKSTNKQVPKLPQVEVTRVGCLPEGLFCLYTKMMNTKYYYLSGLGDSLDTFRRIMLWYHRVRGRDIRLIPMRWSDTEETYQQKQQRILATIEKHKDGEVVLIGDSAGGAMALRTLLDRPDIIDRIVTICGYNHTATALDSRYRSVNPALVTTVEANDRDRNIFDSYADRIMTLYAAEDAVVKSKYSRIEGARSASIPGKVHQLAIVRIVLLHSSLWQ